MILYLDTSAIVKLFVEEEGSEAVREAVRTSRSVVTHLVACCEAASAFGRRGRERGLPTYAQDLLGELDATWRGWRIVSANEALVQRAAALAISIGLRAYDSLHLAAAEATAATVADRNLLRFAVFDRSLADAARRLGLSTL